MEVVFKFITEILPSMLCILAIIFLIVQYYKDRDNDWSYFIISALFYILAEFSINVLDEIINLNIDIIFYICFYATIFLYLKNRKKGLLKNPSWNKSSQKDLFMLLIIDFFTLTLVAFLVFYCFDRGATNTAISYNVNAASISTFIYPVLDFILLGYYTYLSKNYIMNDRKIYPYLSLGFIIWTIGDLLYAFEAIFQNGNYKIGGLLMTFSLIMFMYVGYKVKMSMDSPNYSTIDLFLDSSKFNHLTIIMIGMVYIYLAVYLYCYVYFKDNIAFMDTVETCGVGMLLLCTVRHNIRSLYSHQQINELKKDARIDPLTGLYTRKYAFNMINSIYNASRHFNMEMSALMMDIDHFKKYNDRWGHACGDQILKDITQLISSSICTSNIMCRYGGEEILVIMPGIGADEGIGIAESIRRNVEKYSFYNDNIEPIGKVTISIGGATTGNDTEDEFELIRKADKALYESKKTRNRCSWINLDCHEESNSFT